MSTVSSLSLAALSLTALSLTALSLIALALTALSLTALSTREPDPATYGNYRQQLPTLVNPWLPAPAPGTSRNEAEATETHILHGSSVLCSSHVIRTCFPRRPCSSGAISGSLSKRVLQVCARPPTSRQVFREGFHSMSPIHGTFN